MQLPFFYEPNFSEEAKTFSLSENSGKHALQVLRMKANDELHITNGNGLLATAKIISANKKECVVQILSSEKSILSNNNICIAVSPTKNNSRIEWLLEKLTEIGIKKIVLLQTNRTEKQNIKLERLQNIIVAAMLQSQQTYLPEIVDMTAFEQAIKEINYEEKYIAHCANDGEKIELKNNNSSSKIILIGPEGDFTNEEINLAKSNGFKPVSLGKTRLRTETAAFVAAILISF